MLLTVGCGGKIKYTLPPLAQQAAPNLTLDDRPVLDLTDREILDMEKASPSGTGKILKNQARWQGYADIADAAVQQYQEYITEVFTPAKK